MIVEKIGRLIEEYKTIGNTKADRAVGMAVCIVLTAIQGEVRAELNHLKKENTEMREAIKQRCETGRCEDMSYCKITRPDEKFCPLKPYRSE